ncbi:Ig-like group 1 domain-containing protein [Pseudoduganella sp. FT26W]|uniref:Ig-like group 1 domain-containing protein n=1 Tax=Duganella aquatilis TaxID=2666082 RepID=A0A844DFY6_9BURK|nr:Ig-like domain-containing protein [Duganella aquatilis]MRW87084.1 Ig-like group 1 domain-containing protein [Duganella aquatilis]
MNKFTGWLTALACAGLLAACGGGGGSPGTNSNGVAPSKAASVTLTADATTIASSGLDGTEVTLTAIVKDAGGNALAGETVSFSASSGTITSTNRSTNSSGQVVEKLSVKGDASLRTITITASAGNAKSSAITVQVVNAVPTLTLTADSGTLPSGGTKNVTVTALVRDANNNVVPNVSVSLKSDSGSLTVANPVTSAQGIVTGTLGIGGDATSRNITVSASVPGATATPIVVRVSGNVLTISAAPTISAGASADVTVKLVDSAGNALVGMPVTYGSNANALTVKGGGAAVTNSAGQLVLSYTASGGTADVITVKAMGEIASTGISINSSTFAVRVLDGGGNVEAAAPIGGCQQVAVTNAPGGSVTLSTSRGTIYSDAGCSAPLSGALGLSGGAATAFVNATGPGVATLTANAAGQTTQTTLAFYAPVTGSSTITLQVDPATIGTNTSGSTSEQATLRAVVRDGTAQNNLVQNASVSFSILSDPSGGRLTEPSVAITGADGAATTSFIAGSSVTATNGVRIQARLNGGSNASATATLTVAQKSMFISAGTGNTVGTPGSTTYQLDYVVIVTDAAGNAVSGVNLTASVLPATYYKGALAYTAPTGPWEPVSRTACANEDVNNNGILDAGEDINGNGVLDPGIPVTVTPSVTTDASGRATVSLVYPRDRVYWLDVNMTIRGQASGTESRYTSLVHLIGLSTDYTSQTVRPPGATSPYGVSTQCSNPL